VILVKLFFVFAKIGLFSFGGGYAMIPLIQKEIERNGWMSAAEFINIIAIAEMTPGPIAVNSATFVGYKTAGIIGGIIATIGVALPSMVLILLVAELILKNNEHPLKVSVFSVLRPIVTALILAAAFVVAKTSILTIPAGNIDLSAIIQIPLRFIDLKSAAIAGLSVIAVTVLKLHPILTIVLAGGLGIVGFGGFF